MMIGLDVCCYHLSCWYPLDNFCHVIGNNNGFALHILLLFVEESLDVSLHWTALDQGWNSTGLVVHHNNLSGGSGGFIDVGDEVNALCWFHNYCAGLLINIDGELFFNEDSCGMNWGYLGLSSLDLGVGVDLTLNGWLSWELLDSGGMSINDSDGRSLFVIDGGDLCNFMRVDFCSEDWDNFDHILIFHSGWRKNCLAG